MAMKVWKSFLFLPQVWNSFLFVFASPWGFHDFLLLPHQYLLIFLFWLLCFTWRVLKESLKFFPFSVPLRLRVKESLKRVVKGYSSPLSSSRKFFLSYRKSRREHAAGFFALLMLDRKSRRKFSRRYVALSRIVFFFQRLLLWCITIFAYIMSFLLDMRFRTYGELQQYQNYWKTESYTGHEASPTTGCSSRESTDEEASCCSAAKISGVLPKTYGVGEQDEQTIQG